MSHRTNLGCACLRGAETKKEEEEEAEWRGLGFERKKKQTGCLSN